MNIYIVSQCEKRALTQTRRILDQFAERRGERTWQTAITLAGLDTLRKLLKKSARRNTAVACHWVRARDHTELLWIVGDRTQFNETGAVPTNITKRDVLRSGDENSWHTLALITLAAEMAALWHDFGKANLFFQNKLKSLAYLADPYRHEWVSLRLFQAFVGASSTTESDQEWLQRLAQLDSNDKAWQSRLICDGLVSTADKPFANLPPFARHVGWLILSHHRLPVKDLDKITDTAIDQMWTELDASWAHPNKATDAEKRQCWQFPKDLPTKSTTWCAHAKRLAQEVLKSGATISAATIANPFIAHLARLALISADHQFSNEEGNTNLRDKTYAVFANTRAIDGERKQQLDEHLIGVAQYAKKNTSALADISNAFPRIARGRAFSKRSSAPLFAWQNKAFDLAVGIQARAQQQGFFGVNMASTGRGKTLANARIMYGLADTKKGARFSVALGLRTLTLQTGDAYRERLKLADDDMAVMIGSAAVRVLHKKAQDEKIAEAAREKISAENPAVHGSESAEFLLADGIDVRYDGAMGDGPLAHFLKSDKHQRMLKLLSAPVLVCTIDHLMPACETTRGGHHIGPILRLLTADLVLDEPDDFDLNDLPALTRLVYFAGLFGSRVLLSSATLPPALVQGLFAAYLAGRTIFQRNVNKMQRNSNVCCAWFDEENVSQSDCASEAIFRVAHEGFVNKRLAHLLKPNSEQRRKVRIQELKINATLQKRELPRALAKELPAIFQQLHADHHTVDAPTQKLISFGLIRMANIGPLIGMAQTLLALDAPENTQIHYCVYHSRFPLIVRSAIEQRLDQLLQRHDHNHDGAKIFNDATLREILDNSTETNHIFIVIGSPVTEVGRDHDYDWAIVEPSSMRSFIQLGGRVRRHRAGTVTQPNIVLLNQNLRALGINEGDEGESACAFKWPGFESKYYMLKTHKLASLLKPEDYTPLTAAPRIVERFENPQTSLIDLEHTRLRALLTDEQDGQYFVRRFYAGGEGGIGSQLTGFEQTIKRFRNSAPEIEYYAMPEDAKLAYYRVEPKAQDTNANSQFKDIKLTLGAGICTWAIQDCGALLANLVVPDNTDPQDTARKYALFTIIKGNEDAQTQWHPILGYSVKIF